MGQLADIISNAINYMKTAQVSDIIDIILVAVLIYVAIGSSAAPTPRGWPGA